jgi:hypothetical protein
MDLSEFTLEYVRNKNLKWMEEKIIEWVPLVSEFLSQVMEGKSVLIVTDYKRKWVSEYILNKINNFQDFKPTFIPFFDLVSIVPQIENAKTTEHFDLIEDMLNIAFNENYIFWYIGVENRLLKFVKRKENSFFWIMDIDLHKNFFLKSLDENLDLKLIDLVNLLNETLKKVIFGEVEL